MRTLYISRDATIPTLQSAVIDGDSLVLTYNEDLYEGANTGNTAYGITIGTNSAVNPSSVSTSGKKITLTLTTAVTATDTVTLAYTKPGGSSKRVEDLAGNDAAAFSSQAVTNETDVPPSTDETLSALTVNSAAVPGFGPDAYESWFGVASTVDQATVAPQPTDPGATFVITPADADNIAPGHQVALTTTKTRVTIETKAENTVFRATYILHLNKGVPDNFGWKAVDDFDNLARVDNDNPAGIWSDGTTMWVADSTDKKIYAYTVSTEGPRHRQGLRQPRRFE